MIARVPRPPVATYVDMATAAHWLSLDTYKSTPKPADGTVANHIDVRFNLLVADSAELLVDVVWAARPWRRLGLRKRLALLRAATDAVAPDDVRAKLEMVRALRGGSQ